MVDRVKISEFRKVASTHEHFIWHFLQREQNQTGLGLFSYFDEPEDGISINYLRYILDNVEIPYFESYTEESIDFLMDFGIPHSHIFKPHQTGVVLPQIRKYTPIFLGFNKFKLIGGTHQHCYCPDYFIELINELNPEFLLNSKFD